MRGSLTAPRIISARAKKLHNAESSVSNRRPCTERSVRTENCISGVHSQITRVPASSASYGLSVLGSLPLQRTATGLGNQRSPALPTAHRQSNCSVQLSIFLSTLPASIFGFVSLSIRSSVLPYPLLRCWPSRLSCELPVCRTLVCQLIHHYFCGETTKTHSNPVAAHGNGVARRSIAVHLSSNLCDATRQRRRLSLYVSLPRL